MVNMFQDSRCSVTDMLQTQVFTYVESVSAPPKSLSIHFDNSRCSVIDVFQAQIPMLKVFQLHPFHSCRCLDMLQTQVPYVEVAPPKHFNIIKTSQSIVSIQFQLESFAGHDFNGIIPQPRHANTFSVLLIHSIQHVLVNPFFQKSSWGQL